MKEGVSGSIPDNGSRIKALQSNVVLLLWTYKF